MVELSDPIPQHAKLPDIANGGDMIHLKGSPCCHLPLKNNKLLPMFSTRFHHSEKRTHVSKTKAVNYVTPVFRDRSPTHKWFSGQSKKDVIDDIIRNFFLHQFYTIFNIPLRFWSIKNLISSCMSKLFECHKTCSESTFSGNNLI